jgi:hypothetical protein
MEETAAYFYKLFSYKQILSLVHTAYPEKEENAALYSRFSIFRKHRCGVPKTVSRLALVSACQLLIRKDENAALYILFSLYFSGSTGVPKTVSRLALVSACQLLIRKDENVALHLFQPFVAEALLYACKVTHGAVQIKASAFAMGLCQFRNPDPSLRDPETVAVFKSKKIMSRKI